MNQIITYTCLIGSPLGEMTAIAENDAITGLWFIGQKYYPKKNSHWVVKEDYPVFKHLRIWLKNYFSGIQDFPEVSMKQSGTQFQMSVWELLSEIPYGETTTYGTIAKKIARKMGMSSMSAQAVGGAVGRNPITILIPCHRVMGANKSLTGYAGGIPKKEFFLKLEKKHL